MANSTTWDEPKDRTWQAGVSHGVIYYQQGWEVKTISNVAYRVPTMVKSVAWNGLTSISEKITDNNVNYIKDHGARYMGYQSYGEFEGTIECYTYPDILAELIEDRAPFWLSYQIRFGDGNGELPYPIIHLIKNAYITSYSYEHQTINDTIEPQSFSFDFVAFRDVSPNSYVTSGIYKDLPLERYNLNEEKYTNESRKEIYDKLYSNVTFEGNIEEAQVTSAEMRSYVREYINNALSDYAKQKDVDSMQNAIERNDAEYRTAIKEAENRHDEDMGSIDKIINNAVNDDIDNLINKDN